VRGPRAGPRSREPLERNEREGCDGKAEEGADRGV